MEKINKENNCFDDMGLFSNNDTGSKVPNQPILKGLDSKTVLLLLSLIAFVYGGAWMGFLAFIIAIIIIIILDGKVEYIQKIINKRFKRKRK